MTYAPGLDGLRALSVGAVLLYHSGYLWAQGGFLGVEIFFVISGYLITSLLLTEWRLTGRIDLPAFWARRARRLLPALVVLLGVVTFVTTVFFRSEVRQLRGDVLAASGYLSNWWLIVRHQSYFQHLGRPPLLQHLWSLAIEEQFYLVWPVMLLLGLRAARGRWRWLSLVVLVAAVVSAVGMAMAAHGAADPSRAYYGTGTRAAGLLMGSFLAFWWSADRLRVPRQPAGRWLIGGLGAGALLTLLWAVANVSEFDVHLYRGGFLLIDVAVCVTIAAAVHPGSPFGSGVLGWGPLRWVGLRSYAIYLWHWPVFMLTRPHLDVAVTGLPLLALRLGITIGLSDLSFRLIEQPIRAGGFLPWRTRPGQPGAAAPLALLLSLLVIAAVLTLPAASPGSNVSAARAAVAVSPLPILVTSTSATPTRVSSPSSTAVKPAPVPVPSTLPAPPPAVTAVGDSVMLDARTDLTQQIKGISVDANIGRLFGAALADLRAMQNSGRLGPEVVVHLGTNGMISSSQLDQLLRLLSGVRRVVIVNVKVPRPWEGPVNGVLATGVKRWHNAVLADWHALASVHPEIFWNDGVHLRPVGALLYARLIAASV